MKRPFRLVTRTMGVTFITVAVILSLVFVVLVVNARDQVRAFELEKLDAGERAFSRLEAQRQRDEAAALAGFAESPTLKAALDTFATPQPSSPKAAEHELELRTAVSREVERLATLTSNDVVATVDVAGLVFASGGPAATLWRAGAHIPGLTAQVAPSTGAALLPSGAFRYRSTPLTVDDRHVGSLVVATILGHEYARELARLSDAGISITVNDAVVAGTAIAALPRAVVASNGELRSTMTLNGGV